MPIYDLKCADCGRVQIDVLQQIAVNQVPCEHCGGTIERAWLPGQKANAVIQDEIPGGVWIKNGICNENGTPRKYYSKSEMKKEADRRGLVNRVEHVTSRGTDKNPNTSRWI